VLVPRTLAQTPTSIAAAVASGDSIYVLGGDRSNSVLRIMPKAS
jgi:hypothetical protein